MSNLIGKAAKGDSLVITFSGHGTYQPDTDGDEADGLDEALCPYDLQTNGQALTDDEIKGLFADPQGRCAHRADCRQLPFRHRYPCRQGGRRCRHPAALHADGQLATRKTAAEESRRQAGGHRGRRRRVPRPCSAPIRTSSATCCSPAARKAPTTTATTPGSTGRYNGAFTYYALKALKALKAGATYADWHKAIAKYLPSASYPQSPQIVGSDTARKGKVFA
jgi:hypothetical protein